MYATIINNEILQYPANPAVDNPNVSFPNNWGGGEINGVDYVVIQPTSQPSANIGWSVVETTPSFANGVWNQAWSTQIQSKENIKVDVSNHRYNIEVGGVKIGNNVYSTDRESQTKYVAVAVDILQSNVETWSITWKTADSDFVTLNAPQMQEVITGVRQHVQNCFNKEAEYFNLIDTANTSVLEATDFSAGWPSNN